MSRNRNREEDGTNSLKTVYSISNGQPNKINLKAAFFVISFLFRKGRKTYGRNIRWHCPREKV